MVNGCSTMNTAKKDVLNVASSLWELYCSNDMKSCSLQARLVCGCSVVSFDYVNSHGDTKPVMIGAIWAKKIASILNYHNNTHLDNIVSHVHIVIMSTGAYQIQFK